MFDPGCLVLSCSPRAGGNSDTAAQAFSTAYAKGRAEACAQAAQVYAGTGETQNPGAGVAFLRDFTLLPCTDCDACGKNMLALQEREYILSPHEFVSGKTALKTPSSDSQSRDFPPFLCPQSLADDSAVLLRALACSASVCITAPIYFYHLPAQLKALLDRTQTFWRLKELLPAASRKFFSAQRKKCRLILMGGRKKGKKLFAGSLLSLDYALSGLGLELHNPLLLYGLETPDSLKRSPSDLERVWAYGHAAGQQK
ncbi:MAG: NAD(P)H-dependent oxidoreductase [Desulfovibrio sp.]|nr:NAD(P)H-dependent oxidoreductase [Desulfovibrio sp.]